MASEPGARYPVVGGVMRPGGLALTQRLLDRTGLAPGDRVLDIGCGAGETVAYLIRQGYDALGVDNDPGVFPGACRPASQLLADAARLPFDNASFDAVLLECALSVMPAATVLAESHRILRTQGLLCLADLCAADGPLSPTAWQEMIRRCGFRMRCWEDHTPALLDYAVQALWETGGRPDAEACTGVAFAGRPGYFIAVAEKEGA